MQKPQILLSILGIGLVCLIYFGAKTTTKKVQKQPEANANEHNSQSITAVTFNQIREQSLAKLDATQKQAIQALEGKTDTKNMEQLSTLWAQAKQANMAAKYKADLAKLENSEKSLTFASQYFIDLFNIETNAPLKKWQAAQAIELLEKVKTINPKNQNATIALASCYIDGEGETMKGVQMLLGVVKENPKNVDAAIVLGKLAVQSTQYDKAITRLTDVLKIAPQNTEAMYHLAQAYKGKGDVAKAKEILNNCKKIVNKAEFTKEIDEYIKTF